MIHFYLKVSIKRKRQNFINDYVAYTVESTKCLGLKVINAGGTEFFKQGGSSFNLDDIVPHYGVSSRQILKTLNIANEDLKKNIPFMYIVTILEFREI